MSDRARRSTPPVSIGRSRGVHARAIGSLVPQITQKSFEKHGFAAATLIMDWAVIVGSDLARKTQPLKLKWPRAVDKLAETVDGDKGRPGATLVLQVDPAAALDIEYKGVEIRDRINAYFGYRAVAALKLVQESLVQEPLPQTNAAGSNQLLPKDASRDNPGADVQAPGATSDPDPLQAALARLGQHVIEAKKSN